MFGGIQRGGNLNRHAFVAFPVAQTADRQGHGAGGGGRAARAGDHAADAVQLGQIEILGHGAGDAHDLTDADIYAKAVVVDEDAFGRGRITVGVAVLFLDEEAAQLRGG